MRRFRCCGPVLLASAIFTSARSVDVPRRTRRSVSTVGGAAPDVTIGRAAAHRAGARPYQPRAPTRRYADTPTRRHVSSNLSLADPILCRNAAHDVFPFQINRSVIASCGPGQNLQIGKVLLYRVNDEQRACMPDKSLRNFQACRPIAQKRVMKKTHSSSG